MYDYGRMGIYTGSPLDLALDRLALARYDAGDYGGKEERQERRMERRAQRNKRRFDPANRDRYKLRKLVKQALAAYVYQEQGKKPRNFRVWGAGQGKAVRAGNRALKAGKSLKEALFIGLSTVLGERKAKKYGNTAIRFYMGKGKKPGSVEKKTQTRTASFTPSSPAVQAAEGMDYETSEEAAEEMDEAGLDEYEDLDEEEGLGLPFLSEMSTGHKVIGAVLLGVLVIEAAHHYKTRARRGK